MAKDPSAGRFLGPKLRGKAIRLRVFIMRYVRFLGIHPTNLLRYFQLIRPRQNLPTLIQMDSLKSYNIACILDEFSFESFRHESNFSQISAKHWKQDLERIRPHMILIESAWKGLGSEWSRKISNISNEIIEVIDWARSNHVPTVFFHKEVPPHFETFMFVSKMFDHIFLTDAACIKPYRERVGHDRVHFMAFAAQPKIHGPIRTQKRADAMIYAGSFYPEYKYPERYRNFMDIYDALIDYVRIDIYDRNAGKGIYGFPEKFHRQIKGSLPYAQMNQVYKTYEYGLNMNSVKDSESMCSRRIFELIMSDIFVVGNYSRAVKNYFGSLTISSDDKQEVLKEFRKLNQDRDLRDKIKLLALRKVLSEHTYRHRLIQMMGALNSKLQFKQPSILVIDAESDRKNFDRQAYENKHCISIGAKNLQEEIAKHDYIAVMSKGSFYGKHYLTDLVHGFEYAESNIIAITKHAHYKCSDSNVILDNPGLDYHHVNSFYLVRSLIKSKVAANILAEKNWDQEIDGNALSNDRFNYCEILGGSVQTQAIEDAKVIDLGKSLDQIQGLE